MSRKPRPSTEPLLGRPQWRRIVFHGLALAGAVFAAMAIAGQHMGLTGPELITVTFLTLAFSQLWHVFNLRHPDADVFVNEVTRSPWVWASLGLCSALLGLAIYVPHLRQVLGLAQPDMAMWTVAIGASLAPLLVIQATQGAIHLLRRGRA